jgi:hypothetical protein
MRSDGTGENAMGNLCINRQVCFPFLIVPIFILLITPVIKADLLVTSNAWFPSSGGGPRFDAVRFSESNGSFIGGLGGGGEGPGQTTVGPDGNIYQASINLLNGDIISQIEKFNGSNGAFLQTLPTSNTYANASGIAVRSDGIIFVSSHKASPGPATAINGILRFDGTSYSTFIPQGMGGLSNPSKLLFGPDGDLYAEDGGVIRRYDQAGNFQGNIASGIAFTFGPDHNLYVALAGAGGVARYNISTGNPIDTFIPSGSSNVSNIADLSFGPDNNLYIAESVDTDSVVRYSGSSGSFLGTFIPKGSPGITVPLYLTFAPLPEPSTALLLSAMLFSFCRTRPHSNRN